MVRAYLAVLKAQRRVILWVAMVKLHRFVLRARENLTLKKGYYMYLWSQQVIAIALKTRFQRRMARTLGGDVWFREQNRVRQSFAFTAIHYMSLCEQRALNMLQGFLLRYMNQVIMGDMVIKFRVGVAKLEDLCQKVLKQSRFRLTALKENITHERQNLINQYYRKTHTPLKLDQLSIRAKQAAELERQNQSDFLSRLMKLSVEADKN